MQRAACLLGVALVGCGNSATTILARPTSSGHSDAAPRTKDDAPSMPAPPMVAQPSPSTTSAEDGLAWTAERFDDGEALRAVWGASAEDVFAVGVGGTIVHSNGDGQWRRLA